MITENTDNGRQHKLVDAPGIYAAAFQEEPAVSRAPQPLMVFKGDRGPLAIDPDCIKEVTVNVYGGTVLNWVAGGKLHGAVVQGTPAEIIERINATRTLLSQEDFHAR